MSRLSNEYKTIPINKSTLNFSHRCVSQSVGRSVCLLYRLSCQPASFPCHVNSRVLKCDDSAVLLKCDNSAVVLNADMEGEIPIICQGADILQNDPLPSVFFYKNQ